MVSALISNGSRVLTPEEVSSIRRVISKPSNQALFDLMIYSGLRLEEVRQLVDCPGIFDEERGSIVIRSGKAKATQKTRNVILSDKGVEAVRAFLQAPKMPATSSAWQTNLIRWSKIAGISPLPDRSGEGGNVYGITVRTSRKTWESWLITAYPNRAVEIAMSQGHTESIAIKHYLNCNFTKEEKSGILDEVHGWGA